MAKSTSQAEERTVALAIVELHEFESISLSVSQAVS